MKRLVVIGNGFDKAHNLPTAYSDFMKEARKTDSNFYDAICAYIPEDALWSTFEEALSYLDEEQLRDDNSCYLLGYGDDNWSDSAHHDFQHMIEQSLDFAEDIPIYFKNWLQGIDTNATPIMPLELVDKNNIFLSFNYTDTLERVYGISPNKILYIHGKAYNDTQIIVGHHDDAAINDDEPRFDSDEDRQIYYDNYDEDIRVTEANQIIKNYFKTTYKDTASIIEKNQSFFEKLSTINEIIIYGHSLSYIDFDYFVEIRDKVSSVCNWRIMYYSEEDYLNAQNFVNKLGIKRYSLQEV